MAIENREKDALKLTDQRVSEWAEWMTEGRQCSTGILHKVMKLGPVGASIRGSFTHVSNDMPMVIAEVDDSMQHLPRDDVAFMYNHYSSGGTIASKSKGLQWSKSSYEKHLNKLLFTLSVLLGYVSG